MSEALAWLTDGPVRIDAPTLRWHSTHTRAHLGLCFETATYSRCGRFVSTGARGALLLLQVDLSVADLLWQPLQTHICFGVLVRPRFAHARISMCL